MGDIVTVDFLADLLKRLQEQGNGKMKVRCKDTFLHEDEVFINYIDGEMKFDGDIFHVDVMNKIGNFCADIEKAKKSFYEALRKEQREGE